MDKKYQVFVSSTYKDLIDERQKVIEALLGKNCFPVGMEYFPAANDDQFTVIKRLIDSCDYYILIIGGRYGSVEPKSGKSYTQLEFEYAISKGIPVASFYHNDINRLTGDKLEENDNGKKKLEEFKALVQTKLCDHWESAYELAFKVNKSLDYLFENSPRTGWVKANLVSSAEANDIIYNLRKENEELKNKLSELDNSKPDNTEALQQGDDQFSMTVVYVLYNKVDGKVFDTTWDELFTIMSPWLIEEKTEDELTEKLAYSYLMKENIVKDILSKAYIQDEFFQTIKIQFLALGVIKRIERKEKTLWTLTPYGFRYMMQLKALRKK
jgi:hypothetical protein